jgi:serine/threonine-protein kinase
MRPRSFLGPGLDRAATRAKGGGWYASSMIGTTMGRYRILEPIGQGGMGRVFLAEDPVLSRRLAVKVLPSEFTHDPLRRERLLHEARAASALNHPNIIVVHDLGESEGALFVAMEVVDGPTLRGWAAERARDPVEILHLRRPATAALAVAHNAGLVHRDLKPENMLVRKDGLLKILDFGLARSITPAEGRTATMPGTVMGTAPYMSPEQVLGKPAGPASDVFSLGTVLYELLTGRHPFAADSSVETMHRILHDTPDPPSRVNARLTSDFDFVLAKALSKDPQRRHGSMRDLDVDLETLECGCGPAATPAGDSATAGPRAIAVLPFKNIGGNPDLNFLGVGLADAVITRLSTSPDLIVRATSSIAPYENQPVDPRRVGQELGVTAILDASYQKVGDRFRATARLTETPGGRAIWAGKVDLRYADIFEVQDQVAQGIADALTARISSPPSGVEPDGRAAREYKPSPEAFELVLKGLETIRSANRDGVLGAIQNFQRAVLLEPGYARAWAALGSTMHSMIDGGFDSDPTWYVKAQAAIDRAHALDPGDAIAIFGTAKLHLVFGRKREAYTEFLEAKRRMPNSPDVYHYFSYLFRLCNMLDEGIEAEQAAQDLDPLSPWWSWGMIRMHLLRRDLAMAESWVTRLGARFPGHPRFVELEGELLVQQGRFEEAAVLFEERAQGVEVTAIGRFDRALVKLKLGDESGARAVLPELEAYGRVDMDFASSAASLWGHLGDPDKAFEFVDRAVALGNDTLARFENPYLFGPLQSDPRWAPFVEAMRARVEGYRRELRWPLPD